MEVTQERSLHRLAGMCWTNATMLTMNRTIKVVVVTAPTQQTIHPNAPRSYIQQIKRQV